MLKRKGGKRREKRKRKKSYTPGSGEEGRKAPHQTIEGRQVRKRENPRARKEGGA